MVIADTDAENEGALLFLNAMGFSERAQHVWLAKTLQKPQERKRKNKGINTHQTSVITR